MVEQCLGFAVVGLVDGVCFAGADFTTVVVVRASCVVLSKERERSPTPQPLQAPDWNKVMREAREQAKRAKL